jgi:2-oxoglutarate dehydrogenase E1 component
MEGSLSFVEELYENYQRDSRSVPDDWAAYFSSLNGVAAGVDRIPFLESIGLFDGAPRAELEHVAKISSEILLEDGEVLFERGQTGRDLFVVLEGSILIRRTGRLIAALGRGEVVGEMAVFDSQPRSADAVARGKTRLLCIKGQDLLALFESRPRLARGVISILSKRLRETGARQDLVDQLIRAYRVRGHLIADLNPLGKPSALHPELDPAYYGFSPGDLDILFSSATIPGANAMTLRDILALLRTTYCRYIGVQFMHIDDLQVKDWIQERMEATQNRRALSRDEQLRILTKLTDAEIFEQFIHAKFVGAKRFSLEGAETLIPLLDLAIEEAANKGVKEIVIGMAHRGRLNVLANIMNKSAHQIFREFDDRNPARFRGGGDVKYHLGHSYDRTTISGSTIHLSLAFNPSHLEFVGPVVLGRVRAKQDRFLDQDRKKGLAIIIHGDAAFSGQGVVQEMLNMSELAGYSTGGTVHIVLNNQIGFTTDPGEARSTPYATDVARMLQIPVFHVNGEHPEPVSQVVRLAMDFREAFKKDVVIDMYCYRRHGHNEGDEPAFTQPQLYETIKKKKGVREAYLDNLLTLQGVNREEAEGIVASRKKALELDLVHARSPEYVTQDLASGLGVWRPFGGGRDRDVPEVDTTCPKDQLSELLLAQARLPDTFTPHPKVKRLLELKEAQARGEKPLDWAAAESLAFASLLKQGTRVRLSGQDSERGTFSHRHAVLHDVKNGNLYTPLMHLGVEAARFEVINSPLTEIAVLGFDYGYSLDYPDALVIWEAQFGDFANVPQVIIDQFITSGEDKWNRYSGLVMLLPHAFEGQGPEHSSARPERFLSLAAEDNIQIVNLTTPAQIFHCLRRQVMRPWRKPLVVMSPKSLLRHREAISTLEDLSKGSFQRIIPDRTAQDPSTVKRVLLTSGKLYYELAAARAERKLEGVAIVRVEQYYPLDVGKLEKALPFAPGTPVVWVQEEPINMGAWSFLYLKLGARLFDRYPFSGISRAASASPATGSHAAHKMEQQEIIEAAFSGL